MTGARVRGSLGSGVGARRAAAPLGVVLVASTAVLVVAGVRLVELLVFAGYEFGFVLVPGALVVLAADREARLALRVVAIGWPVGYTLSVVSFAAATAAGSQGLYVAYPLVTSAVALLALGLRRRGAISRPRPERPESDGGGEWWLAGAGLLAVGVLWAQYFATTPLPRDLHSGGASYDGDTMYFLSLAGEALHHFPLTDPTVSATPLVYHVFSFVDMAAVAHTTGIDLSVVVFRLSYVALVLVLVLQLGWLTWERGRSLAVGALAASFALLLGEIDLTPRLDFPFLDIFTTLLWFGPGISSFVVFVPLAVLLGEELRSEDGLLSRTGRWVLIAVLLVGVAGTKGGSALPVLVGAAGLLGVVRLSRSGLRDRQAWRAAVLFVVLGCFFLVALTIEYGGGSRGLELSPLKSFHVMPPLEAAASALNGHPVWHWLFWWIGAPLLGTFGFFAGWAIGAVLLARDRSTLCAPSTLWLGCLIAVSIVPLFLFFQFGLSHLHSLAYGRLLASVLIAEAVATQLPRLRDPLRGRRWAPVVAACLIAVLVVVAVYPLERSISNGRLWVLDYGVAAACVAVWTLYVALGTARPRAMLLQACSAVAVVALLNTPVDSVVPDIDHYLHGRPSYAQGELFAELDFDY